MDIWLILMLILAAALIIGPIMMLKPNPSQSRREQWRLQARDAGLRFRMQALPKLPTDTDSTPPVPVYYLSPSESQVNSSEWMLMRTAYEHEGNFYHDWDWQGEGRANQREQAILKEYLPRLSQGVRAISNGPKGTAIFWDEKGKENLVPLFTVLLRVLQGSFTEAHPE